MLDDQPFAPHQERPALNSVEVVKWPQLGQLHIVAGFVCRQVQPTRSSWRCGPQAPPWGTALAVFAPRLCDPKTWL